MPSNKLRRGPARGGGAMHSSRAVACRRGVRLHVLAELPRWPKLIRVYFRIVEEKQNDDTGTAIKGRIPMRLRITRRTAIRTAAFATAAFIAAPYVRGAHAAGRLSIGFWDHWVPGANSATRTLVEEWAAKEKVDVSIDYIPSQGMKNLITIAAESQARSGHDIFAFPSWQPHGHAESLQPVNDIMDELIKQNGAVNETVTYLGKSDGKWLAVPATVGSQIKGPCSRIDLSKQHAGIDLTTIY